MKDFEAEKIFQSVQREFEGKTIYAPELGASLQLVKTLREQANQYSELYHCTEADVLLSIITKREFWLSNLQCVNDKEEPIRINHPDYERSYYVACFTRNDYVDSSHWSEYGNESNGVLFSIKKNWFLRDATFLTTENDRLDDELFRIFATLKAAQDARISKANMNEVYFPFAIEDFGFYAIIYDNCLKKQMCLDGEMKIQGVSYAGDFILPSVAGLVKTKKGMCYRKGVSPYEKNWENENEIRLKVCVEQVEPRLPCWMTKIAVPLSGDAFDCFKIRFSNGFSPSNQADYLAKLRFLLPQSDIIVLK